MAALLALIVGVSVVARGSDTEEVTTGPGEVDTVGRSLGSPGVGRALNDPSVPRALGFVDEQTDVPTLAAAVGRSADLDRASVIPVADMALSEEVTQEVCPGVERPTAGEEIADARIFRIESGSAVADIRITEFDDPATVDRVVQASRSAWETCDSTESEFGGTVERSVLPFFSLSGTPGVNLQSALVDADAAVLSSSQTLAIGRGNLLVEIRTIAIGDAIDEIDAVQLLADVEELL